MKSQSAIEYIATYWWAILIIAVTLAALYNIGIFANQPPSLASAGSCQILRPNGPGTVQLISAQGLCTGRWPQTISKFDGTTSNVVIQNPTNTLTSGNALTISFWFYPVSAQNAYPTIFSQGPPGGGGVSYLLIYFPQTMGGTFSSLGGVTFKYTDPAGVTHDGANSGNNIPTNQWNFGAVTLNANGVTNTITWYMNGTQQIIITSGVNTLMVDTNAITIGAVINTKYFTGYIANIQIYNAALSANNIKQLYLNGIGGAPIDLYHIQAWWPLNGNGNDYGGNLNSASTITGIYWPNNWWSSTNYQNPQLGGKV